MTTTEPVCPPQLGGHIYNPTDPTACVYCGTPAPTSTQAPMATVPAGCHAIRHTDRCSCSSAMIRLHLLLALAQQQLGRRRPWWRA